MTVDVDQIKQAVRIEDVVKAAGHTLVGHGRYLNSQQHDSLVVDTQQQAFFWNSEGANGDVISWVQHWKRVDFKGAVEFLARFAGLPDPDWGHVDNQTRLAARAKENALTVACRRFVYQLWRDGIALAYAKGRGWTEETIKAAGLGYTGQHSGEEMAALRSSFEASGVDPRSPGAVAMLGLQGPVMPWADQQGLKEIPEDWLKATYLPPIWKGMLVYPHVVGGRVKYVSLRSIDPNASQKDKSKNLKAALVGAKQPYFNHVYGPREESVVLVEGQADAITLAQWGIPAVALCGLSLSAELIKQLKQHKHLYLALDKDRPGQVKAGPLAKALGPLTRLVEWPAHDANDWLQAMVSKDMTNIEDQAAQAHFLLNAAKPIVKVMAELAGQSEGAKGDDALKATMEVIAAMGERDQVLYRSELAKLMGFKSVRDYDNLLTQVAKEIGVQTKTEEEEGVQETVGGYIDGWVVELLYNPERKQTFFAYRNPEGKIGTANQLEINGITYKAKAPDSMISNGAVVLPSEIGTELRESELIGRIIRLIHRYYLIDPFYEKLAAYYVLFTWSFDSFRDLVYLRLRGEFGSGKSTLIRIIGYCCRRLIVMSGADSDAALFRTMDTYKGTLFVDEADKEVSDPTSIFVKIFNIGTQKGLGVTRMRDKGSGIYISEFFDTFSPKVLATRQSFDDEALESRCLTIDTIKHTSAELIGRGIRFHLDKAFFEEVAQLRNALLNWRLRTWQPEVEIDYSLADPMIQARLNQVMMPILQVVKDLEVRGEIQDLVRRYQQRMTTEKSTRIEAKVLQAIVQIQESTPLSEKDGKPCEPYWDFSMGNIAEVANKIIDDENTDGDPSGGEIAGKKLTSRGVGSIVNKKLNLEKERLSRGPLKGQVVLQWNEDRIKGLRAEYGL